MGGPTRRGLLGFGAAAVAAGAVVPAQRVGAAVEPGVLDVHLNEGLVPMVDGTVVYQRGFGDRASGTGDARPSLALSPRAFLADGRLVPARTFPVGAAVPHEGRPEPSQALADGTHTVRRRTWASFFPQRTLVAETGATVRLRLHNTMRQRRRFSVEGVLPAVDVPPGAAVEVSFPAPPAGTYVYCDPGEDGVQRVLGLHGVLLVVPSGDPWRVSPGGVEFERQWLWICHDVDPVWGRRARSGEVIDPHRTPPLPRYFTLNDRSGYVAVAVTADEAFNRGVHEDTIPSGYARRTDVRDFSKAGPAGLLTGQVIRIVNTGVAIHQLHFHGNHVWTFRRNNVDLPRRPSGSVVDAEGHVRMASWEDVVEIDPMGRKDVVLPVKPPPDTPQRTQDAQDCDWHYPMHCHAEMSQTAGGGAYPGGMVSDWVLAAPVRGTQGSA